MIKIIIAIVGIVLFLYGIILGINLRKDESKAISLDSKQTRFAEVGDEVPLCSWNVSVPERVIAENKTQAIIIETLNPVEKKCEATVSLHAPGFDASPSKEDQKVSLPSKSKGTLSWILTPRNTGTYQIAVSDVVNSKIFGVTVTNVFGLSAIQAKILSILGSLFGPMLTVPWWWEKLRQQKPK